MKTEAFPVDLPSTLYLDLSFALRRSNDTRQPNQIVILAVKAWMAAYLSKPNARGFQWKTLFLPDGTDLRMRYLGKWYYAKIEGDDLMFAGDSVSPRDFTIMVTGRCAMPGAMCGSGEISTKAGPAPKCGENNTSGRRAE